MDTCALTQHESHLLSRLINVLSFAADSLAKLDSYATYWPGERDTFLRQQDKVAAEAILLAYLASRVPGKDTVLTDAIAVLCDRAERQIVTSRNEALLRRFPQTATTIGGGFVLLMQLGRSLPSIEKLLRRAVTRGFVNLTERSIFRLMDTRWTYGLLDSSLVGPVKDLVPFSTLSGSPHPIYTMKEDDYALTHALYYLTDFGCRPPPHELQVGLAQCLDPFLGWSTVRLDLDLLGEFLIATLVLRTPPSATFQFAWHVFFNAWEVPGGLVGPEYSATRFAQLHGEEAAAYAFLENYHTVFVGGILCAVALTVPRPEAKVQERPLFNYAALRDRCTEAAARACSAMGVAASGYEPFVPPPGDLPEWIVTRLMLALEVAPESAPLWLRSTIDCQLSREDLAGVLYDALLIAAATQYNLVQLAEALAVGAGYESMRSPTLARALDFLLDQQLDKGFIGIQYLLTSRQEPAPASEAQEAIAGLLARIAIALKD